MPRRCWTPPLVLLLCTLVGIELGAVTNLINVRVSAIYYAILMRWDLNEVPHRAILQGMLEGGGLGLGVGLLLAIAIVASTGCRCPLGMAVRRAFRAVGIAMACWVVGGVIGLVLALFYPAVFQVLVAPLANNLAGEELNRFAWVGGTIIGAYVGSGLGLIYAAVSLHLAWKRMTVAKVVGFPVEIQA